MTTAAANPSVPRLPLRTSLRRQAACALFVLSLALWTTPLLFLYIDEGRGSWRGVLSFIQAAPVAPSAYGIALTAAPALWWWLREERPWMTPRRRAVGLCVILLPCAIITALLVRGVLVDALFVSAVSGDGASVQRLLNWGVSANARERDSVLLPSFDGDSPLHWAADGGHVAVARLLIQHGAKVTARNHLGWTPLHSAALSGDDGTISVLLEAGADVNARDTAGLTPLFLAAKSPAAVHLLLEAGADVHERTASGQAPLICAAQSGRTSTVRELLQHGAPLNDRDAQGRTALSLARRRHHADTVEALQSAGAR